MMVAVLKRELEAQSLDTLGLKAVLKQRLLDAIQ